MNKIQIQSWVTLPSTICSEMRKKTLLIKRGSYYAKRISFWWVSKAYKAQVCRLDVNGRVDRASR